MQVLDPPHGAKNGSLQPLSMARMLLLGNWPDLAMQLVELQRMHGCGLWRSRGRPAARCDFAVHMLGPLEHLSRAEGGTPAI